MISKENFIKAITFAKTFDDVYMSEEFKFIDLDMLDSELLVHKHNECEILWKSLFDEVGFNWIWWWINEKNAPWRAPLEAHDKDGNIIPTKTVDDLWELVKDNRL